MEYVCANLGDIETLVQIYHRAFFQDYVRYGYCPAYTVTSEMMEASLARNEKHLILDEDTPVGVISMAVQAGGIYHIGCLCVLPEYQGRGIGTQAIQFVKEKHTDWNRLTLETPLDKEENVAFYTKKCGFSVVGTLQDENVRLFQFELKR